MKHQEKHILEIVYGLTDEIINFTSRLVAEPSTLGNESSVLRVMEDQLTSLGFSPVQVPIDVPKLKQHPGYAPVRHIPYDRLMEELKKRGITVSSEWIAAD